MSKKKAIVVTLSFYFLSSTQIYHKKRKILFFYLTKAALKTSPTGAYAGDGDGMASPTPDNLNKLSSTLPITNQINRFKTVCSMTPRFGNQSLIKISH